MAIKHKTERINMKGLGLVVDQLISPSGSFVDVADLATGFTESTAIPDLTAATGTADGTVADATASFDQTITNNNNKEFATKINAILAVLRARGLLAS